VFTNIFWGFLKLPTYIHTFQVREQKNEIFNGGCHSLLLESGQIFGFSNLIYKLFLLVYTGLDIALLKKIRSLKSVHKLQKIKKNKSYEDST
jgi:hypothetical protein